MPIFCPYKAGLGDLITREVLDKYLSFAQISGKAQSGDERMAGISALKTLYVVDTSYLVELYKTPAKWAENRNAEAVRKITAIIEENINPLFVTAPMLFEFARHVAQVADGNKR